MIDQLVTTEDALFHGKNSTTKTKETHFTKLLQQNDIRAQCHRPNPARKQSSVLTTTTNRHQRKLASQKCDIFLAVHRSAKLRRSTRRRGKHADDTRLPLENNPNEDGIGAVVRGGQTLNVGPITRSETSPRKKRFESQEKNPETPTWWNHGEHERSTRRNEAGEKELFKRIDPLLPNVFSVNLA
ncbi:unnamed protein product [Clavelina lepadiformis]|uniref:Uncharacterized protein n=1 Tax=Clavelina lepadiformis TaxID=159417 RepID=A0ABP0G9A5_CLALP